MKLPNIVSPFLAVFFVSISQLPAQQTYHVTQLPAMDYYSGSLTFSYGSGTAYGLNDSADVVTQGGILYSGGGATRLPSAYPPPQYYGSHTTPWDVNNSGVVVGHGGSEYFDGYSSDGSYQHGFLYNSSGSTMTDAGLLSGGLESRLFAINNSGAAAGWSQQLDGLILRVQAATFSGGLLTNVHNSVKLSATDAQSAIFGITDTGKLAGFSISAGGAYQAFSYDGSASASLGNFGGTNSVALGLSDSATVGWAENALGQRQAFVHNGAILTNLDATFTGSLASSTRESAAAAINDAGTIVGQAWEYRGYTYSDGSTENYNSKAFVSDGTASYALTDLVNSSSPNLWKITSASDINASGQIAATADSSYYQNAVVLTPETAWTAASNGLWDTTANWQNSTVPGADGAAFLNLADGVTVTGPAADHTLYALTVGSTGTSATLALQAGGNLTVRGDTELRAGGVIDATDATLETSYLHGTGTVNGTLNAGLVHVGNGKTLTLQGTVSATSVELGNTGTLKASGVLHSQIAGASADYGRSQGGAIELTGDATLGGNDISSVIRIKTLNVADHSATLLTSGALSHITDNVLLGTSGEVTAATGLQVNNRMSGGGVITGNVQINSAIIQPGVGNSLVIDGNLRGSGLLVGSNITVTGSTTPEPSPYYYYNYEHLPSANIGAENALVLGSNAVTMGGHLEMSGGTVTAANGLRLSGRITGSGVINGPLSGGGTITATGALTLGDATSANGFELTGYYYNYYSASYGTLDTGANTVTLLDSNAAQVNVVNLGGGSVIAANGLSAESIIGTGDISGALSGNYSRITATGNLSLGDASSSSGVNFSGRLDAGAHTITLRDADFAKIGKNEGAWDYYTGYFIRPGISIAGGTIHAANGLELFQDGGILASGSAVTSTINGNLLMNNSTLEATAGNTLAINGTLSGFGVLLGNVTATSINATAGDVVLSNTLDVGSRSMTVIAQSRAVLGQTTSLAGGLIGASNGLGLGSGSAITGYGTVNPGPGQFLQVTNGILEADAGQTLAINGDLQGYGVTIGTVTVAGTNSMFTAPSGQVDLTRNLDIGNRTAVFHSNAVPVINSKVSLAGGTLSSVNGIHNRGEISGSGTISSNITLQGGALNASGGNIAVSGSVTLQSGVLNASGGGIAISGSLSGYGVVVGSVTAGTNTPSPTGHVGISSVDIGSSIGTVYSSDRAYFGKVASQGGTLNTGTHGATINRYEGYGTLNGDVHMDGGLYLVDVGSTLNITGTFTGYGIVAGAHNKGIAAPTGRVNYSYAWNIGRSDITVYSLGVPQVQEVNLQPGARIFSAQGWEFANLAGGGTIGGNVTIQTVLSPGFSPGTIIFENDLTLAMASSTVLEFAGTGAGQYDFLDIAEAFTMGGNLQVNFLSGFDPGTGLLPEWFSADSFSGTFNNMSWSGLGSGKSVTFDSGTGRLGITEISSIPEASTLALILPAAGILLLHRRRARKS